MAGELAGVGGGSGCQTRDCLNGDLGGFLGFSGWRVPGCDLGVETGVGREFMRVYEGLREIGGEIGVGMGWRGWWGLAGVFFGVKVGGRGGWGAVLGVEGGCGGVLGRG